MPKKPLEAIETHFSARSQIRAKIVPKNHAFSNSDKPKEI